MILTDREIRTGIESDLIIIDPPPKPNAYSSTSVDLTLDPVFSIFKKSNTRGMQIVLDPAESDFKAEDLVKELTESHTVGEGGYQLLPNKLILAWTAEYVDLRPSKRLAARVEGKSSLARLGLGIHVTAPTVHGGFDGRIRLEIINHGEHPIILRKGMRICQLVFEQTLGTPEKGYSGQFSGQTIELS